MFNDKYGLTKAVLEGRKTQTRRVITGVDKLLFYDFGIDDNGKQYASFMDSEVAFTKDIYFPYQVGDVVAIAQAYKDIFEEDSAQEILGHPTVFLVRNACDTAGWKNKMFVKADSMKHHIGITNVRVERLQDISYKDCIAEGIYADEDPLYPQCPLYTFENAKFCWETPKNAYSKLIDKVAKIGTWKSNPWVFVYEFELVD